MRFEEHLPYRKTKVHTKYTTQQQQMRVEEILLLSVRSVFYSANPHEINSMCIFILGVYLFDGDGGRVFFSSLQHFKAEVGIISLFEVMPQGL